MIWLQNASDSWVEVVVMEIMRDLIVLAQYYLEITTYQIQTLQHWICFIETCLGKNKHHESVKQNLIFYQLHVTSGHLGTEIEDAAGVHLPEEDR